MSQPPIFSPVKNSEIYLQQVLKTTPEHISTIPEAGVIQVLALIAYAKEDYWASLSNTEIKHLARLLSSYNQELKPETADQTLNDKIKQLLIGFKRTLPAEQNLKLDERLMLMALSGDFYHVFWSVFLDENIEYTDQ